MAPTLKFNILLISCALSYYKRDLIRIWFNVKACPASYMNKHDVAY